MSVRDVAAELTRRGLARNAAYRAAREVNEILVETGGQLAGSFVAESTFDDLVGDTAPTVAFIDVASGAQSDTQGAITELTATRTLHLSDSSELRLRLHWLAILSGRVRASLAATGGVHTALDVVKATIQKALHQAQQLVPLVEATPGFAACSDRADAALTRLRRWRDGQTVDDDVRWFELTQRGFTLHEPHPRRHRPPSPRSRHRSPSNLQKGHSAVPSRRPHRSSPRSPRRCACVSLPL